MQSTPHKQVDVSHEEERLFVTQSFLPPLEEYQAMVAQIWESGRLTNNGPFLKQFEASLRAFCSNELVNAVNNGTIALQIMIEALGVEGEVITTPFSYVATSSSLKWQNCQPVFADIDPNTYNLDPAKIESCITENTTAILATHVFGSPCDVEAIGAIAEKHGLILMYDAAHAFGVSYKGRPLVNYGHASILSFHATKLFHSIEGGAIITNKKEHFDRCVYMRNFGHHGEEAFQGKGINGKLSEFHAAMGVLNFKYLDQIMLPRKQAWLFYYDSFNEDSRVKLQHVLDDTVQNHSYFSLLFDNESQMLKVREALHKENVFPRRYFYPSLNTLPYANASCPVAEDIASRILCIPIHSSIELESQEKVVSIIRRELS